MCEMTFKRRREAKRRGENHRGSALLLVMILVLILGLLETHMAQQAINSNELVVAFVKHLADTRTD